MIKQMCGGGGGDRGGGGGDDSVIIDSITFATNIGLVPFSQHQWITYRIIIFRERERENFRVLILKAL